MLMTSSFWHIAPHIYKLSTQHWQTIVRSYTWHALQVSIGKTKVMTIGDDTQTMLYMPILQNQPLEQVDSFEYLGLPFHQSGHIVCHFSSHQSCFTIGP